MKYTVQKKIKKVRSYFSQIVNIIVHALVTLNIVAVITI